MVKIRLMLSKCVFFFFFFNTMFNVSNEMVPLNFLFKVTSRLCICCCCDWFSLPIRLRMHPFSLRWKLGFYLENVGRHYGFIFIPCSMVPWIITHKKKKGERNIEIFPG